MNLRSRTKNAALYPHLNLKTRYDEISDILSYVEQLNDAEKDFMNRFVEEEINANLKHKGKKINTTKADKKRCYDRNNARNRCIYTRAKASNSAIPFSYMTEGDTSKDEMDDVIDKLDRKYTHLSWEDDE
jgi:hypothetical protein